MRPYTPSEIDQFEQARAKMLERFGSSFDGHYGWASHVIKSDGRPIRTLGDVEDVVLPHLQPFYQLASHNVHAKSRGIYHRLGLIDADQILLSGSSNAGLADPGQNAALFLAQVSTALGMLHATFETVTMMKLITRLQRKVSDSFGRAHHDWRKTSNTGNDGVTGEVYLRRGKRFGAKRPPNSRLPLTSSLVVKIGSQSVTGRALSRATRREQFPIATGLRNG